MPSKTIKEYQNAIRKNRGKNHAKTLNAMIKLGDYYCLNDGEHEKADLQFNEAKAYVTKNLPAGSAERLEFEYQIDRGLLCGIVRDTPPDRLNRFIEKYQNANLNLESKQNFYERVANFSIVMENYEQAKKYLTFSMELLKQFPSKNDEYHLKKAKLYGFFVDIAVEENNIDQALKYLDKALNCKNIEMEPYLYFTLLGHKRKLCPREKRMDISIKMHKIWEQYENDQLKEEKFDCFIRLFEDYFFQNNFKKAEKYLLTIYNDEEALKMDEKSVVKKSLIFMQKRPERLKQIQQFEDSSDHLKLIQIYQILGNELFETEAYELAFDFYLKMKKAATDLPDDSAADKLQHLKNSLKFLTICFKEFACCQKDYKKLLQYFQEYYDLEKKFGASDDILIQIQLDRVLIKAKCDNFKFEEKGDAFLGIKDQLSTDIQKFRYYAGKINFIKNHQKEAGNDVRNIPELEKKLKFYKNKTKNHSPIVDENNGNTTEEAPPQTSPKRRKRPSNVENKGSSKRNKRSRNLQNDTISDATDFDNRDLNFDISSSNNTLVEDQTERSNSEERNFPVNSNIENINEILQRYPRKCSPPSDLDDNPSSRPLSHNSLVISEVAESEEVKFQNETKYSPSDDFDDVANPLSYTPTAASEASTLTDGTLNAVQKQSPGHPPIVLSFPPETPTNDETIHQSPCPEPSPGIIPSTAAAVSRNNNHFAPFKYFYPGEQFISKCCEENFGLKYNYKLRQKFLDFIKTINIQNVCITSKPFVSHPTNDETGFGCISMLFTGSEENTEIIRKKINQKFAYYFSQSDNFDEDKLFEVTGQPYMLKCEHLETICRWLECRVMVYYNEKWELYGNWNGKNTPLFRLEKKTIKEKEIYQVVMSVEN